jgi:hypothetical protein
MIGRPSMATGVAVAVIKKAWELREAGYGGLLPTRRPIAEQPPEQPGEQPREEPRQPPTEQPVTQKAPDPKPKYKPGYHPNSRAPNEALRAKKEPVPGKRICSGKCGQLKDLDQRSAWCKDCIQDYQRARYLSSQKLEKLGPVLRFILEDGDEHAGMICADCREPCRIGDEVLASEAVLRHARITRSNRARPLDALSKKRITESCPPGRCTGCLTFALGASFGISGQRWQPWPYLLIHRETWMPSSPPQTQKNPYG